MASIQDVLNKPNPDYDPNSPASKKRRALMQENPAADIRAYIKKGKCVTCGQAVQPKAVKSFEK